MPGSDDLHARTTPVAPRRRGARRLWRGALWVSTLLIALTGLRESLPRPAFAAEDEIVWKPIGVGLEEAHFQLPGNSILAPSIVAIRASLQDIRPRVIRATEYGWKKASVKTLCKATGARACINSNFFDEQGKPLGLIISRGILHQKPHNGGGTLTGIFFVTPDGAHITHRSSFTPEGVIEAAQAGPRLISEGAPVVGLKNASSPSNLSIACIDKEKRLLLVRVTLAVFGGSLKQIQDMLLRPEIACVEALNLDGGGSSQLYVSTNAPEGADAANEEDFAGRDEVPVALGLFPAR